jgi:hypothetical protein
VPRTQRCPRRARRPRPAVRLFLEGLEPRCLLSAAGSLPPDALFHETLDQALDLSALAPGVPVSVSGAIGAGPHGAADVNWYEFELSAPADVHLMALHGPTGSPLTATLSLYNDAPFDPFSPIDPYTPDGHRLLAQDDAGTHAGPAVLDRLLGPGKYWVAVSGSGNDLFYPFLADSGLDGRTGSYTLSVTTSDPGAAYDDPAIPVVLASDPAPNTALGSSPFVLRFDLNTPIDPSTVTVGNDPSNTAQLWFNTTNDFSPTSTATQVDLSFALVSLEQNADGNDNELQIALANPLAAGYYQAVLAGYGPGGSDYVTSFQITGPVGNTDPNQQPGDSIATALNIPKAGDGRLHQVAGAIGVDPTDPLGFNPAAVQLYHFTINGPGLSAFDAEVFAGRIGSPLDPALTLYRVGALGDLEFVASNGNTSDGIEGTDGHSPLLTDPALLLSLPQGQYYLAVSSGLNYPDPLDPTRAGVFNPFVPQSAFAGNSTGPYVLNLLIQPAGPAPQVVAVLPQAAPTGAGPLTGVRVRFSQPVNLQTLGFQTYQQLLATPDSATGTLASVSLTDAAGHSYALALDSYDAATSTASFVLLDGVPAGVYTLRLSGTGPQGITNYGGIPLQGNVPGSTLFSASFVVTNSGSSATSYLSLPGFASLSNAQPLGVLFPDPLSNGITITRDASAGPAATEQDYRIQLLQQRQYFLTINGLSLPGGLTVTVLDAGGAVVNSFAYDPRNPSTPFFLAPGSYTLRVTWLAGGGAYELHLSLGGTPENPVPLVVGSGPALRARLLSGAPDTTPLIIAGTPAPPVTGASTGSFLPFASLLSLPSNPLIAQAFSPLNGVAVPGGTDGGPLIVQAPTTGGLENILFGVLIGTQPGPDDADADGSASASSPAAPGTAAGQSDDNLATVLRLVDALFEYYGWLDTPAPDQAVTPPTPPTVDDGGTGDGGLGAALPETQRLAPDNVGLTPLVLALAAGALLIPARSRRHRAPDGRIEAIDAVLPKPR